MLLEAVRDHDLNLAFSFMVGNRLSDIEAGLAAGCAAVLLDLHVPAEEKPSASQAATYVAPSWESAANWILQRKIHP
jgi:D-glycero-D-manno-heptose 1,7-bisphosphate phosphatase